MERHSRTIPAGSLGGWIEGEKNLSHEGNSWVGGEAMVFNNAHVYENGVVIGNVVIADKARVYGNAIIRDTASLYNSSEVCGNAVVGGSTLVLNSASIFGDAYVSEGSIKIFGNARIHQTAGITLPCKIGEQADIESMDDYIYIGPIGDNDGSLTFYRDSAKGIRVASYFFEGTIEEFLNIISESNALREPYASEYAAAALLAKARIMKFAD